LLSLSKREVQHHLVLGAHVLIRRVEHGTNEVVNVFEQVVTRFEVEDDVQGQDVAAASKVEEVGCWTVGKRWFRCER
jgi:hypothetical protein